MSDVKKASGQFAVALTRAVAGLKMYNAEHPQVIDLVRAAGDAIVNLLQHVESIEFGQRQGEMFLGKSRVKGLQGADKLIELLEEKSINTICVSRGTAHDEMFELLKIITAGTDAVIENSQIMVEVLDRVPHVTFDDRGRANAGGGGGGAGGGGARTMTEGEIVQLKPVPTGEAPNLPEGYRLLGQLGEGGQGAIYKVRNQSADRFEACKSLTVAAVEKRKAFVREIRLQGKLNHQAIGQIYFVDPDFNYYLMEYLPGGTLRRKLDGSKPPGVEQIAFWVRDSLYAAGYAHQRGVIHRDIKPENILFDVHGNPKVCDFGIASSMVAGNKQLAGTPHYMAPEQWDGGDIDHRADIWAFGVILYEALTGVRPFDGKSPGAIGKAVQSKAPAKFDESKLSNAAKGLIAVAHKALEKDPAQRYETADAFATAIQARIFTGAAARVSASGALVVDKPRGSVALGRIMAAAFVIGLAYIGWTIFGPGDGRAEAALAELRVEVEDNTLSYDDRIEACTYFLSDQAGATDDMQDEVKEMRKVLENTKKNVIQTKRRLRDMPNIIARLLEQGKADDAQKALDKFARNKYLKLVKSGDTIARLNKQIADGRIEIARLAKERAEKYAELMEQFDDHVAKNDIGKAFGMVNEVKQLVKFDWKLREDFDARITPVKAKQRRLIQAEEKKIHKALDAKDWDAADACLKALERFGAHASVIQAQTFSINRARGRTTTTTTTQQPTVEKGPFVFVVKQHDGFTVKGVAENDPKAETVELQMKHMKLSIPRGEIKTMHRLPDPLFEGAEIPKVGYKNESLGFIMSKPSASGWSMKTPSNLPLVMLRFYNTKENAEIDLLMEPRGDLPFIGGGIWVGGMPARKVTYHRGQFIEESAIFGNRLLRWTIRARVPSNSHARLQSVINEIRGSFHLIPATGSGKLAKRFVIGRQVMDLVEQAGRAGGGAALDKYKEAVKLYPSWALLQFRYAQALKSAGRIDRAISAATLAHRKDLRNLHYRTYLANMQMSYGRNLINQGKHSEGMKNCQKGYKVIKKYDKQKKYKKKMADAYHAMAEQMLTKQENKKAVGLLNSALKLFPTEEKYREDMAEAYFRQGKGYYERKVYGSAKGRLEKALKYYPHKEAKKLLGMVKSAMKNR